MVPFEIYAIKTSDLLNCKRYLIKIFYIFIPHFVAYNIYKNQCSEVYISYIKFNFKSGRNLSFFIGCRKKILLDTLIIRKKNSY